MKGAQERAVEVGFQNVVVGEVLHQLTAEDAEPAKAELAEAKDQDDLLHAPAVEIFGAVKQRADKEELQSGVKETDDHLHPEVGAIGQVNLKALHAIAPAERKEAANAGEG